LLCIQQVKNCHIICFTYSRWKSVTLFALHTAGEYCSHYLFYKQQVKNSHIICFTYSRCETGEKLSHYSLYKQQVKIYHNICFTYSRCETVAYSRWHTADEKWSHDLLYKQQVKICHIICFTNSRWISVTLFALHTLGEKLSHYWLYKQQVWNCHIICFAYSRWETVTLFAFYMVGAKHLKLSHYLLYKHQVLMDFAKDATWWFSPLHWISPNKGVLQVEVFQHWISLIGGKKDLVSQKYWNWMLSLWLLISLMDRNKDIHGVCTACHMMAFTTS
jgi:hypothetical protein